LELEREIAQDLERLYPGHDFFHVPERQDRMRRILTLWSLLHPDISYRYF
jgi:hypothetical protein